MGVGCNVRSGSAGPYGGIPGPSGNTDDDLRLFYRINRPGTWAKILASPTVDLGPGTVEVSRAGADDDVWRFGGQQQVFIWVKRAPRPPPPPELKLKCEPSRLPRGNSTTCTATAQPADGFVVQRFSFAGDSGAVASQAGDHKSWTFTPPQGGTVTVTATVAGTNLTATARVDVVCNFFKNPTDDRILDNAAVQDEFKRLWVGSNPDDPGPGRIERGAFITEYDSALYFFRYLGPSTRCTSEAGRVVIPPGHVVVGFVHTHPDNGGTPVPSDGSCHGNTDPDAEFKEGPSQWDRTSARRLRRLLGGRIPGFIIDLDDVHRFGGDLPSQKFRRNLSCS